MLKNALLALRASLAPTEVEDRSGFEFVWFILLFSGAAIVLTLLARIFFVETI